MSNSQYSTDSPPNAPLKALATVSRPLSNDLSALIPLCAHCGAPLAGRRRQARYCSPTCRAADFDRRTGRRLHTRRGDECAP